jgi:diaminopimelate decarboxylase
MKKSYERPIIQPLHNGSMNKYGQRSAYQAVTELDGIPISDLLDEFGSPLFVFSEQKIRDTYQQAYRAFSTRYPKVQFAWSYKTNYLNAVCQVYHQLGSWAEVVSGMEYEKAILNGVDPQHILFNGPDKTDDELRLASKNGSPIHIDHLDELYRLTEIARELNIRPKVAIRVNMDTGVYPQWDRFGFNYENGSAWDAINKIVLTDTLDLIGLHCHIGTFMLSTQAYAIATSKMCDLALNLARKHGRKVAYIDMGGGFASRNRLKGSFLAGQDANPSFDEYAEVISSALMNAGFTEDDLPLLILETGRALIDDSGYLLGTVISNKRLADGRRATIVDFGVNIMFTSYWYDHEISPAQDFGHFFEDSVIYGPLCMNIDIIRDAISLPPLKAGDHLVVHSVGAYNVTQSMQFITLRPAIVLIDLNGHAHCIKKRESLSAISSDEITPAYLQA